MTSFVAFNRSQAFLLPADLKDWLPEDDVAHLVVAAVDRVIEPLTITSFRITARRAFKTFPLTSTDINRELGAHVLARRPETRVDLHHAALNVHVEVLPHEAFIYPDRRPGPGGLPVGSGGTVAALISGGIDSPVASWRMIKRGCRVLFVHFHSVPYLPATSLAKARALAERLTVWQYTSRLYLVPSGEIQLAKVGAQYRAKVVLQVLAQTRSTGDEPRGQPLHQAAQQFFDLWNLHRSLSSQTDLTLPRFAAWTKPSPQIWASTRTPRVLSRRNGPRDLCSGWHGTCTLITGLER
jgi:virulence-associated protein VagC